MGRSGYLASLIAVAACGRVGFELDPIGDASAEADTTTIASCATLAPTCGPMASASCCGSPLVPAGTFYRGYDVATDGLHPDTGFPATISAFRLDTYPVTVGRFRQFVAAGEGTQQRPPPAGAGGRTLGGVANEGGWDPSWNTALAADTPALVAALQCDATYATWTGVAGDDDNRPITCITWYEAMAFCVWDGGHLPTEAEYNYAASGGDQQRAYPWSNPPGSTSIDCTIANYGGTAWPSTACEARGSTHAGSRSPQGDGAWGHADLAGNSSSWVLDWYDSSYPNPCNDCASLTAVFSRRIRGGGFSLDAPSLRTSVRRFASPAGRGFGIGVRCARAP